MLENKENVQRQIFWLEGIAALRILMISTEYPPMHGGVGRYTANLVNALRKLTSEVYVVCDNEGDGDYRGISPANMNNSELLLDAVNDIKPDIVHIQFEPGLYGLVSDPANPKNTKTYIDSFYRKCKLPIVTTFHSVYTYEEWMSQVPLIKKTGRTGILGIPARALVLGWRSFLNYKAFVELNREKLKLSQVGISFSHHMSKLLGGTQVIYHGAEPALSLMQNKEEARRRLSLPQKKMIAVVIGFRTVTKGWDLLDKLPIPQGWVVVVNSAKSHYNRENYNADFEKGKNNNNNDNRKKVIDLERGFLSDEELSTLLYASDAVLLPYKVTSGSGVMFDALAHGLPFVSSDLAFFREFARMGLGVAAHRCPKSFAKAIYGLEENYESYAEAVNNFRKKLLWESVAKEHIGLYEMTTERQYDEKVQATVQSIT